MAKFRKVQQTNTGTFFVCLTRAWAEKHGLKKGVQVSLEETSDGKLCIDARVAAEPFPKVAVLCPGPFVSREIISRYLLGFDVIRIEGKERFDFELRSLVKRTIASLVGLEIVEETSSLIVLQCLLPSSVFSPDKLLLRNFAIVAGMGLDAVTSLVEGDFQLARSVVVRDDESDRQFFLLVRVLRTMLQDPSLGKKLGLTSIDCMDYRLVASLVETLGDLSTQIAHIALELNAEKPSEELKTTLLNLQADCSDADARALKAFIEKDAASTENIKNLQTKIISLSDGIEKLAKNQTKEMMMAILSTVSALKQTCAISVDITNLIV
jgi:phosphate uptake regulator